MPEPDRPIVLFSAPISYDLWKEALDRICRQRLSLSLHDLPDLPIRAAYDAGTGPALFFEEAVLPRHGAQDGDAASDAPDHEDLLNGPSRLEG